MKLISSVVTVSLLLAASTVFAHEPNTPTPATTPQAMDNGKMDMSNMTPADHEKMAMAHFAKLDTNKDGMLSKAEFAKLPAMMGMQHDAMDHGNMDHSMMGVQDGKMDHGKMDMSGKMPQDHQKIATDEFVMLDSNKDGKLSKAEIPAKHRLAAHFDMLDSNKDGSLSQAEFSKLQGM